MAFNPPSNSFLKESSVCHVCDLLVFNSGVFCELCFTWLHIKCIKINQKHYKKLANSPLPYFCQACLSHELPFLNITPNQLKLETFNSNYKKPVNQPCHECNEDITSNQFIHCKIGNHLHPFHLTCTGVTDKTELNYKLWSCRTCLNFPFQDLDNILLNDVLTNNHLYNSNYKKNIKFEDNFAEFKHLDKLNINLNGGDPSEELLNFEYYQIEDFIKMKQGLHSNSFSIIHSNIRSFNKNAESFDDLLSILKFEFDIIGLSETWDSTYNKLNEYTINGYHPFESKSGTSQNSGVGFFIKDNIDYTRRNDLSFSTSGKKCNFECLFLEIKLQSEHILAGVVYRHPNGCVKEFTQTFENMILKKIKKEKKKIIIMG